MRLASSGLHIELRLKNRVISTANIIEPPHATADSALSDIQSYPDSQPVDDQQDAPADSAPVETQSFPVSRLVGDQYTFPPRTPNDTLVSNLGKRFKSLQAAQISAEGDHVSRKTSENAQKAEKLTKSRWWIPTHETTPEVVPGRLVPHTIFHGQTVNYENEEVAGSSKDPKSISHDSGEIKLNKDLQQDAASVENHEQSSTIPNESQVGLAKPSMLYLIFLRLLEPIFSFLFRISLAIFYRDTGGRFPDKVHRVTWTCVSLNSKSIMHSEIP